MKKSGSSRPSKNISHVEVVLFSWFGNMIRQRPPNMTSEKFNKWGGLSGAAFSVILLATPLRDTYLPRMRRSRRNGEALTPGVPSMDEWQSQEVGTVPYG